MFLLTVTEPLLNLLFTLARNPSWDLANLDVLLHVPSSRYTTDFLPVSTPYIFHYSMVYAKEDLYKEAQTAPPLRPQMDSLGLCGAVALVIIRLL